MPRKFHTSARLRKILDWTLRGTTDEVNWVQHAVQNAVDRQPDLNRKASKAIINGNPHQTKRRDGTIDDWHASGILQTDSNRRLTSYHAYKSGRVRFSKEKYNTGDFDGGESSSHTQASSSSASSGGLTWRMSADGTLAKWWDGRSWQPGQWSNEQQKWVAHYNGVWYAWES